MVGVIHHTRRQEKVRVRQRRDAFIIIIYNPVVIIITFFVMLALGFSFLDFCEYIRVDLILHIDFHTYRQNIEYTQNTHTNTFMVTTFGTDNGEKGLH